MATVQLTQGLLNYFLENRRKDQRDDSQDDRQADSSRANPADLLSDIPLILLSASPGEHRDFSAVIPQLAQHFEVIAPDWPGYGASTPFADPAQASAMAFYEVLVEFLDALAITRAIFIGNSVGGYAATRLAIEQPQRVAGMVLVSPGGFTPHNAFTRAFCRWQGSALAIPPGVMARLYLRRHTGVADAMRTRAKTDQSTPQARMQVRAVWRSFITEEHDLRAAARLVQCPVQLVYGSFDPVIPWWLDGRAAQRAIPHAAFVRLPSGHAPFAEIPEEFLAATLPFLRGFKPEISAAPFHGRAPSARP